MRVVGIKPKSSIGVLQCKGCVAAGVEGNEGTLLRHFCRACEDGAAEAVEVVLRGHVGRVRGAHRV